MVCLCVCRRHRALEPAPSSFAASVASMQLSQTSVSLDVLDKKSNVKFILKIFALKDNTFRIRLSEAEPLRERYEPPLGDVLLQEPEGEE